MGRMLLEFAKLKALKFESPLALHCCFDCAELMHKAPSRVAASYATQIVLAFLVITTLKLLSISLSVVTLDGFPNCAIWSLESEDRLVCAQLAGLQVGQHWQDGA